MPTPEQREQRFVERAEKDHDLLIKVASNVETIMLHVRELEESVHDFKHDLPCDRHFESCNEKIGNKVSWSQFWSIIIIVVGLAAGAIGYNFKEDSVAHERSTTNQIISQRNQKMLDEIHNYITKHGIGGKHD